MTAALPGIHGVRFELLDAVFCFPESTFEVQKPRVRGFAGHLRKIETKHASSFSWFNAIHTHSLTSNDDYRNGGTTGNDWYMYAGRAGREVRYVYEVLDNFRTCINYRPKTLLRLTHVQLNGNKSYMRTKRVPNISKKRSKVWVMMSTSQQKDTWVIFRAGGSTSIRCTDWIIILHVTATPNRQTCDYRRNDWLQPYWQTSIWKFDGSRYWTIFSSLMWLCEVHSTL